MNSFRPPGPARSWPRGVLALLLAAGLGPLAARAQNTLPSQPPPDAASSAAPVRAAPPPAGRSAALRLLRSGPMVTYSTMREVGLWVQLAQAGGAQIEYWEKGRPQRRWRTAVVLTTGPDHIAELVADSVRPGRKYAYRLWAADVEHVRLRVLPRPYPLEFQSQTLWQWRADPPEFRVALGSCTYVNDSLYDRPGEPYGGQYGIFGAIKDNKPDLMVWLGDNTYLREADWDSPTGIRRRYAHTRALKALQPLLGSVHHYATWDDHDYGPNDSDRSFALRETSLQTFRHYWPALGRGQGGGGVASTFTWADVQFFLLDDRWHRTPNRDDAAHGQFLGPEQLRWLTEGLVASRATFKIVCVGGQVLNPAQVFETYANYTAERAELLKRLADSRVAGVVFVSGDRHHAELTRLERPGLYPLYDLTTSPLTAGPAGGGRREPNPLRDSATFRAERNFALLDVSGAEEARTLTLTLCNAEGQPLWTRELRAADLTPGATPPGPVALTEAEPRPVVVAARDKPRPLVAPARFRRRARPRATVRATRRAARAPLVVRAARRAPVPVSVPVSAPVSVPVPAPVPVSVGAGATTSVAVARPRGVQRPAIVTPPSPRNPRRPPGEIRWIKPADFRRVPPILTLAPTPARPTAPPLVRRPRRLRPPRDSARPALAESLPAPLLPEGPADNVLSVEPLQPIATPVRVEPGDSARSAPRLPF